MPKRRCVEEVQASLFLRMRFGPDGVLLDVAVGASGMTGAVAHMVVRKMGPGKAMSGLEGRVG